jgi:DNA adenine methylase
MKQLALFDDIRKQRPINVATVPMRSPFRYAGGKTWFIPYVRKWLKSYNGKINFIEPFAGGGIASLTVAFENLAQKVLMVEKDEDVSSVWKAILGSEHKWLVEQILNFDVSPQTVNEMFSRKPKTVKDLAFQTILRNRLQHGGILAEGAGLINHGENGKGLKSRWYPQTLEERICDIQQVKNKIEFIQGDGIEIIKKNVNNENAAFFIDPPYTIAGKRLYKYHKIDHSELFDIVNKVKGDFVMTYDDAAEIEALAVQHNFQVERVIMKTTHHETKYELVIGKNLDWLADVIAFV